MRKFDRCKGYEDIALPVRKTYYSAGYDIAAAETVMCFSHQITVIKTGLKVYLPDNEYLDLRVRSSVGIKKGLIMPTGCSVIDADYVDNPENEGHIMIALYNTNSTPVVIKQGEFIAQGIFQEYKRASDEHMVPTFTFRKGGIGSTDV